MKRCLRQFSLMAISLVGITCVPTEKQKTKEKRASYFQLSSKPANTFNVAIVSSTVLYFKIRKYTSSMFH